jgi:hypothetical protein
MSATSMVKGMPSAARSWRRLGEAEARMRGECIVITSRERKENVVGRSF